MFFILQSRWIDEYSQMNASNVGKCFLQLIHRWCHHRLTWHRCIRAVTFNAHWTLTLCLINTCFSTTLLRITFYSDFILIFQYFWEFYKIHSFNTVIILRHCKSIKNKNGRELASWNAKFVGDDRTRIDSLIKENQSKFRGIGPSIWRKISAIFLEKVDF